jgi:hypothetical protein
MYKFIQALMNILLFNKACLYDPIKDETVLYGQYKNGFQFNRFSIENFDSDVVFCMTRPDFYIKLKGKISHITRAVFLRNASIVETIDDIQCLFPFDTHGLQLTSTSAIITTMCKDYSHRLDEWIQYNLKLGFSGIIIFDNDKNRSNDLHEPLDHCIQAGSTREICKKYVGKVHVINFPYAPMNGENWTNIQRITLTMGVNAYRTKCRSIALIDADEFICLPKNRGMNIEKFLQQYSTITIKSNILTNKNEDDVLNNNILTLANYVGEEMYTKTILHTDRVQENEFIITPHEHASEERVPKDYILHYHCWMNKRYIYNENMPFIHISLDN